MATGNFWDVTNPDKPLGKFDPDGVYDIPFDWVSWLAGLTDGYSAHEIIVASGLDCSASSETDGVITARIRKDSAGTLVTGRKYFVTCRITTNSGQVEDQTVWLLVTEK